MLHAGLDLSRARVDVHLLDEHGETMMTTTAKPDVGGLVALAKRLARYKEPISAAIFEVFDHRLVLVPSALPQEDGMAERVQVREISND
jgi:hypothetical protein